MEPIVVNALGDACPIPVVKTMKALEAMTAPGTVEVHVDNEAAVQNVTRLAAHRGFAVGSEKLEERLASSAWRSIRLKRRPLSRPMPSAGPTGAAIPSSPSTPTAWAAATTSWARRS